MPKLMHCFTLQREAKWSLCEDETLMQQAHHLPLHAETACETSVPSDLSVSIVQCGRCAGSRRRPHLLMSALCAATLLLQVLLVALPLSLC